NPQQQCERYYRQDVTLSECFYGILEQRMQEVSEKLGQGHLLSLKTLHCILKHCKLKPLAWPKKIGGSQPQHTCHCHGEYKKSQCCLPYTMHLPMSTQVGNSHRDRSKYQWNQHHFQQVDEQRANQPGNIQTVLHRCGFSSKPGKYQPQQNAGQHTEENLRIKRYFFHRQPVYKIIFPRNI